MSANFDRQISPRFEGNPSPNLGRQLVTRIVLHGALAERFGGPFDWGCNTPSQAIYALIRNKPGFELALRQGQFRVVRGNPDAGGIDLDERMLGLRFPPDGEFHIIPVAAGAKSSGGVVKSIIGVLLIAVAVATAQPELLGAEAIGTSASGAAAGSFLGTIGALNTLGGISAGAIGLFGFGLLLGGIGEILSTQPKPQRPNASFTLSGPLNTTTQGGCVPVAYGKPRVGSVVIASGYEAVAVSPTSSEDYSGSFSGGSFSNYQGIQGVGR